jgi:hypothetical protein
MRHYVFEITLTDEDLKGDEMWEEIEKNTNSEGILELTEALQKALLGEFALLSPYDEEVAKKAVKLQRFSMSVD